MKADTIVRMSDVSPANTDLTPMEHISDTDLKLISFEERETQFGRGYPLTLDDPNREELVSVLTSAVVVVQQLDKMVKDGSFQTGMLVNFTKHGRCWVIV